MDVLSQILASRGENGVPFNLAAARDAAAIAKRIEDSETEFKSMSDEALLARLKTLGVKLDRKTLEKLCEKHVSIDEFVGPWIEKAMDTLDDTSDVDSILMITAELWDRWFPEKPSFSRFVGLVEDGFFMLKPEERVQRVDLWIQAYDEMIRLLKKTKIRTLSELDDASNALRCTIHWVESFVILLSKLGEQNDKYSQVCVEVCEEMIELLDCEDERFLRFLRKSMAKACCDFGAEETMDRLFKGWLADDPRWGKGYVAWAKCYDTKDDAMSRKISEQILREGLGVVKVNDREAILRALANNLNRQNRSKEAALIFNKLKKAPHATPVCDQVDSYEGCSCGEPNEEQD